MKKVFYIFILFVKISFSQENLEEVILTEKKIKERISFKNEIIVDSVIKENMGMNLGELLSVKTPIYIKNYGVGGLQTPSFRGTGASHTQLYWNGINLNSPMLGQIDLSLFPVSFSDEISINYGASSLTYGTGGLGGAIHLNSNPKWDREYSVLFSQTLQGFADYYIKDLRIPNYVSNFSLLFGTNRIQNIFKFYYRTARNDFLFVNPYAQNQPVWKNYNSDHKQNGLLNETFFKINNDNVISFKIWYQDSKRNLPASMNNSESYSSQGDNSIRILGNWLYSQDNLNFKIISSFTNDNLWYNDTKISTESGSSVNSIKIISFIDYSLMKNLVIGGNYNYNLDLADSDNYKEDYSKKERVQRKQEIHDIAFKIESKNFDFLLTSLLFRQQVLDGDVMPFLPSLGMNIDAVDYYDKKLSLKINASKNFKAPSLNDKYWYPVGNPDLKPEKGWSYEFGLKYDGKSNIHSKIEVTYFFSEINDWIIWLPGISNLWRPENLRLVRSQGLETILNFIYKKNNYYLEFFCNLSYVSSKNMKPYNELDKSVGHQLVYTPKENIQAFIRFNYGSWKFTVEESFYGKRYTTTDGKEYLPDYYLTNLIINKDISFFDQKIAFQFRINNIFNFHYQSIARKPMPTVNFLFTISYNILSKL